MIGDFIIWFNNSLDMIVIIAIIMCIFTIVGISMTQKRYNNYSVLLSTKDTQNKRFIKIYDECFNAGECIIIIKDIETEIEYIFFDSGSARGMCELKRDEYK